MKNIETFDSVVAINVDIQNDFCPGGALPVARGDEVVSPMNTANRWVRDAEGVVIFTRDWHPTETTHFDKWPVHCLQNKAGAAFHDDLEIINGTDYFSGPGRDLIASKGMGKTEDAYSGFEAIVRSDTVDTHGCGGVESMRLGRLLENFIYGHYSEVTPESMHFPARKKVDSLAIVVGGLATDYCVKATVLDAIKFKQRCEKAYLHKRVGVFALTDAMRAVNATPGDDEQALRKMRRSGAKMTTVDQLINNEAFLVAGAR